MAGPNQLQGTPWHVEIVGKEEGDPRRHRSRCKYYFRKNKEAHCVYRGGRCIGSAHCGNYKVGPHIIDSEETLKPKGPANKKTIATAKKNKNMTTSGCCSKGGNRQKSTGAQANNSSLNHRKHSKTNSKPSQAANSANTTKTEFVVGKVKYKEKTYTGGDPLSVLYADPLVKQKPQKATKTSIRKMREKGKESIEEKGKQREGKQKKKNMKPLISKYELHNYIKKDKTKVKK